MKAFDYSLVKDPQYFCDNRMEAHSDHVYYRDGNEMQAAVQDGTETSFRYSLNGLWKFHYARNIPQLYDLSFASISQLV